MSYVSNNSKKTHWIHKVKNRLYKRSIARNINKHFTMIKRVKPAKPGGASLVIPTISETEAGGLQILGSTVSLRPACLTFEDEKRALGM